MRINGTDYINPEFTFSNICKLEELGISLTDTPKTMSFIRGYTALAAHCDLDTAGKLLDKHLQAGGTLDEIISALNHAVEESGFFHTMSESQEQEAEKQVI